MSHFSDLLGQAKFCFTFWGFCSLWTHWSFINHKLILYGAPMALVNWFHFFLEQILFLLVPYLIYHTEYSPFFNSLDIFGFPVAFSCSSKFASTISRYFLFPLTSLKMNSFYKMNRDYREAWLLFGPKGPSSYSSTAEDHQYMHFSEKYPQNINYREFITYMVYPTMTYQDSFPV
jgi:hypothetical protein